MLTHNIRDVVLLVICQNISINVFQDVHIGHLVVLRSLQGRPAVSCGLQAYPEYVALERDSDCK